MSSVKVLIWGGSGVGKTRLLATAPNSFIISSENGLLSLSDYDIPYVEVKTIDDINIAYKLAAESAYDTICIDTISELTETLLSKTIQKLESESRSGKIDKRQAYLYMAEKTFAMIRNFRDMDKNVIFTCKSGKVTDESTGITTFEPSNPGRMLPDNISYMFDEVLCMQTKNDGTRYLQTYADRRRDCKDRSGKLDKEIIVKGNSTMNDIFNKIKGV